jgi:hypothetical protein
MPLSRRIFFLILFCSLPSTDPAARERQVPLMANSIFEATEQQLKSAEGKISYLGPQEKPIPTVAFSSKGAELHLKRFEEFQYKQKHYGNDDSSTLIRFGITAAEFRRMLLAVKPIVTKSPAGARPEFLSFAVIRGERGQFSGAEFVIGRLDGRAFYDSMRSALDRNNELGRRALSRQEMYVLPGQ